MTGGSKPEIEEWTKSPPPPDKAAESRSSSGVSTGQKAKMDALAARAAKKKGSNGKTPKKRVREEDARDSSAAAAAVVLGSHKQDRGGGGGKKRRSGGDYLQFYNKKSPAAGRSANTIRPLQRRCLDCSSDISSKPNYHKRCVTCYLFEKTLAPSNGRASSGSLRASSPAAPPSSQWGSSNGSSQPRRHTDRDRPPPRAMPARIARGSGPRVDPRPRVAQGALHVESRQLREALEKSEVEAQFEAMQQVQEAIEISEVEPQHEMIQHQELFGGSTLLPLRGPDALEVEQGVLSKAEGFKLNSTAVAEAEKQLMDSS